MRQVRAREGQYRLPALELVEEVFTQYDSPEEGQMVRRLVEEIRAGRYYIPRLELVMVDEEDGVIGYAMFSRFPIEGKYEEELLLLSPVAVKTALQRQHISKDLLEYGFARAEELGFRAVLVEGDPKNYAAYAARGFRPSCLFGIEAGPNVRLPRPECLMAKELAEGALVGMGGFVDFSFYETLR